MDEKEKARIIDKIRKCMRLAGSSNANEAAAALRQARKMMEAAGVSESDIDDNAAIGEVVKTKEPYGENTYANLLIRTIRRAFGVEAVREPGGVALTNIASVAYLEDCCTDILQGCLDNGWRILAVCPPNDARRPTYIIGHTDKGATA